MHFDSSKIKGLFLNERDIVGQTIRNIHQDEKVVVAQGFGLKEEGVPLRFLAYIVPTLHLLKQLPESAIAEFYVAHFGVLRANGLNVEITTSRAEEMNDAVINYSSAIHPEESSKVRFLEDRNIENDQETQVLINSLAETAKKFCSKEEKIQKFISNRGGETSLRYMVEHALYMRDPLKGVEESNWLVPEMTSEMQHIIMIGGSSEKIFCEMRQLLCRAIGTHSQWKVHQFFTPIGGRPPTYHPYEDEPLWSERKSLPADIEGLISNYLHLSSGRGERKEVVRDLLALLLDAAKSTSLRELKPSLAKRIAKEGDIPSDLRPSLQKGWDNIRLL